MKVRKKILNFCSKLKQRVTSNKKKKVKQQPIPILLEEIKQQPIPILPEEIIFEILHYDSSALLSQTNDAPVKEITNPYRIWSDFGDPAFNGSCNGLVCSSLFKAHGFGYDSETDDYKFVDLGCVRGESDKSEMHIYSLRSDSWKPAKYIPYVCKADVLVPGLFFNGSLHWFAKSCLQRNNPSSSYYKVLIALDVVKEVVREVSQPENLDAEKFADVKYVDVLSGCLCMLCSTPVDGFEVWMMKDYGVPESWIQLYKISQLKVIQHVQPIQYLRRIKYLKNGQILVQIKYHSGSAVMLRFWFCMTQRMKEQGF
ncbi:F-box protein CPR1-like [Papaver somniferum]|uniref:F-box protein CPR1-like n=1 Tax=Papaver somniferum TaxID=3469 RepID=UPI000E6FDB07|nr:F-box protein CPR1-like [Papaver somniferum]